MQDRENRATRVRAFASFVAILLVSSKTDSAEVRDSSSTVTRRAEQGLGILTTRETELSGLPRAHDYFKEVPFFASHLRPNTTHVNLLAAIDQNAFDPLLSSEMSGLEFLHAFDRSEQVGNRLASRLEPQYLLEVGPNWNSVASDPGVRFSFTEWLSGVVEVTLPISGEVAAEESNENGWDHEFRVFGSLTTRF